VLDITFTPLFEISKEFYPKPASQVLPEWYKNQEAYTDSNKGFDHRGVRSTIKKCMPVFDVLTAGYIITTWCDLYVSYDDDGSLRFNGNQAIKNSPIEFHSLEQASKYPVKMVSYPKFMTAFSIKTPKGYSSLFLPPLNRENKYINIFAGIVDTDEWIVPVNLPFVFTDAQFEGLIPAGTPIAQVIPFKRQEWQMGYGGQIEVDAVKEMLIRHRSRVSKFYKSFIRQRKVFK
jgi:hypothetical protein